MAEGLFAGLRVIDCASFIAAPAAATILADFGADVIKIEPTGEGDLYRTLHTRPGSPRVNRDYAWILDNRNKRGLALDLKSERGHEVLSRLVEKADIFITNMPFPVRRKLRTSLRGYRAPQPAADLCVVHGLWRDRAGGREDRLRLHRLLGALGADGHGAARRGRGAGALRAGHGRSSERRGAVRRDHDRALAARENRPRRPGRLRRWSRTACGRTATSCRRD